MEIVIKPVASREDTEAIREVRRKVFEDEMGIAMAMFDSVERGHGLDLLARVDPGGSPIAALSVSETTGYHHLHERFALNFTAGARVARLTQLAVLMDYRNLNIPLLMTLEARHQFIVPGQFRYTWLLFNADRAATSSFCRLLGFARSDQTFLCEWGRTCILVRDEQKGRIHQHPPCIDPHVSADLKQLPPYHNPASREGEVPRYGL